MLVIASFSFAGQAQQRVQEGYITIQSNSVDTNYNNVAIAPLFDEADKHVFPAGVSPAWVFSGLANGEYQVSGQRDGEWHPIAHFSVKHYALTKALTLFCAGLFMFIALIYQVLQFSRLTDSENG